MTVQDMENSIANRLSEYLNGQITRKELNDGISLAIVNTDDGYPYEGVERNYGLEPI